MYRMVYNMLKQSDTHTHVDLHESTPPHATNPLQKIHQLYKYILNFEI